MTKLTKFTVKLKKTYVFLSKHKKLLKACFMRHPIKQTNRGRKLLKRLCLKQCLSTFNVIKSCLFQSFTNSKSIEIFINSYQVWIEIFTTNCNFFFKTCHTSEKVEKHWCKALNEQTSDNIFKSFQFPQVLNWTFAGSSTEMLSF